MSDESQLTVARVDLEGSDTVVTAVGTVKESTVGRDMYVCACVLTSKISGQGLNSLHLFQSAPLAVVREGCHGRVQFIYDVGILAVRPKSYMARAGARFELHPGRSTRNQLPSSGVKAVDHDFVCS